MRRKIRLPRKEITWQFLCTPRLLSVRLQKHTFHKVVYYSKSSTLHYKMICCSWLMACPRTTKNGHRERLSTMNMSDSIPGLVRFFRIFFRNRRKSCRQDTSSLLLAFSVTTFFCCFFPSKKSKLCLNKSWVLMAPFDWTQVNPTPAIQIWQKIPCLKAIRLAQRIEGVPQVDLALLFYVVVCWEVLQLSG